MSIECRYLIERGYRRYRCKICGSYFWSLVERDTCGDSPCEPYRFIGNSPVKRDLESLIHTREIYLKFFEDRGHVRIPKYPVVAARWRDDVYLVGASIYVFQPWVTSGLVPPPANPLVISQPCIRFTDIDIVGRSGRHLTGFEMMAHHAFNYPDKKVYWIEETVQLAHEFFTKELGIPEEEIMYKESTWMGGGNAGECFEVLVRGLEVATLVFMHYRTRQDGTFEEMNMKIVDTGYGLERIYWLATGLPNVYEATFRELLEKLRKLLNIEKPDYKTLSQICITLSQLSSEEISKIDIYEKISERLGLDSKYLKNFMISQETVYTIADHVRSLAWMIYDGVLPSNSGIGYLARLLIRRILRYLETLKIDVDIEEIFNTCVDWLVNIYPEVEDIRKVIIDIAGIEYRKFKESINTAKVQIEKSIKKGKKISEDELFKLYDAYGIPPELVIDLLKDRGIEIEIPSNFYTKLVERKRQEKEEVTKGEEKFSIDVEGIEKTRELYYEDPYTREFDSVIVRHVKINDRDFIILRETAFYPEGGGQPSDRGFLYVENGVKCSVDHVFKIGNVIIHECRCDGDVIDGLKVHGIVDWDRRYSLMKMHTGTHILLQVCRRVLGSHIWQTGVQKDIPFSRLDITHYKVPTIDEIRTIEDMCNRVIEEGFEVITENLVRTDAEVKYSVRIYQGGIIPSPILRIVKIVDKNGDVFDVQACGGTHVRNTSEIGMLKIVKVERLQEGVIRIIFTTGRHVLDYVREIEGCVKTLSTLLKCTETELHTKIRKLLEDYENVQRRVKILEKKFIENILRNSIVENINNIKTILIEVPEEISDETIQSIARDLTSSNEILLIVLKRFKDRSLIYMFENERLGEKITVRDIVRDMCSKISCRGGGSRTFGQAITSSNIDLNNIRTIVRDVLCKAV